MSKTKRSTPLLVLALCWVCLFSCGKTTKKDCAKHLRENIPPGASLDVAQDRLKECGFKTTLDPVVTRDPAKRTLYADMTIEGNPVSERTIVIVKLNSDERVVEMSVSSGLVGP